MWRSCWMAFYHLKGTKHYGLGLGLVFLMDAGEVCTFVGWFGPLRHGISFIAIDLPPENKGFYGFRR